MSIVLLQTVGQIDAYLTTSIGDNAQDPPFAKTTVSTSHSCGPSYSSYEDILLWSGLTLEEDITYYITVTCSDFSGDAVALWQLGGDNVVANDADIAEGDNLLLTGGYWGTPNYDYPPASTNAQQVELAVITVTGCQAGHFSQEVLSTCIACLLQKRCELTEFYFVF